MPSRHAIVSETGGARAVGTTRDLRIDLFRGLALWMIFIDHIDGNWLGKFTYRNFGFSDSKEIFIFLSGISCWLLYAKLEAQRGLAWAQFRALYRAVQIYLGYLFVAFFTFVTLFALQRLAEPYFAPGGDFTLLFADPPRALIAAADLYYTPGYLDILPLYLWLVAAAPLLIAALRRAPRLALLASASALARGRDRRHAGAAQSRPQRRRHPQPLLMAIPVLPRSLDGAGISMAAIAASARHARCSSCVARSCWPICCAAGSTMSRAGRSRSICR